VFVGFDGHSERGLVQMSMQRENQVLTVSGDGVDQDDVVYALRLSRRTCGAVERKPGRPRYLGRSLPVDRAAFGSIWDDTDIAHVSRRAARRARSIVLVARGDGGKFEPRACGAPYFAEVVPWL
jgi:hypothetical protein